MNSVIIDIVNYLNDQTFTGVMEPFVKKMGHPDLRGALEILFNWLQLQLRLKHSRPYALDVNSRHDLNLSRLLTDWQDLSGIFEIKDNRLDFKSDLSEETRISIKKYVRDHLKPYLFVTVRPKS